MDTKNSPAKLLSVVVLILLALIYWLTTRPINLPPISGKADYLMSVNEKGEPLPYTVDGVPWKQCETKSCRAILANVDLSILDRADYAGFFLVKIGEEPKGKEKKAAMSIPFISSAHAAGDGFCPIIAYRIIGGAIFQVFHPYDPDCPPA